VVILTPSLDTEKNRCENRTTAVADKPDYRVLKTSTQDIVWRFSVREDVFGSINARPRHIHHWEEKRPLLPSCSQGSLHPAGAEMGRLAPRRRWPDTRGALGRAVPPSRTCARSGVRAPHGRGGCQARATVPRPPPRRSPAAVPCCAAEQRGSRRERSHPSAPGGARGRAT